MAEIKSTLELALERTKKFALSDKEREEIKQKELREKIQSLFHRYGEGRLHLADLEKEIERMEEGVRKAVKEGLFKLWTEGLTLQGENEKFIKGIEWVKGQSLGEWRESLRRLGDQYQNEKDQVALNFRAQSLEALKREGFSGEAIEPNLKANPSYQKALADLEEKYRAHLDEMKRRLQES
ncbi:MAG: hypothetical protein N3G78_06985 [Desulfobacterota bacterium]|nr:hypothetical protein [Thermodesulfobacteriota bacterium]